MTAWNTIDTPESKVVSTATIDGNSYRVTYNTPRGVAPFFTTEMEHKGDWSRFGRSSDTLAEAQNEATEYAAHLKELQTLPRQSQYLDGRTISTPWGGAQTMTTFGEGIRRFSTAGHGGFQVSVTQMLTIKPHLVQSGGWYEEDCEWAKVATAFPELFTARERRLAEETLRHTFPEVWEKEYGRELKEGESRSRDQALFDIRHAHDLVAISASRSEYEGYVRVTATRGGRRDGSERVDHLVPAEEYRTNRSHGGFVVDPDQHPLASEGDPRLAAATPKM